MCFRNDEKKYVYKAECAIMTTAKADWATGQGLNFWTEFLSERHL